VISVFDRVVDENYALLGYYSACSGNSLPKFREKVSFPSSRIKNPIVCLEMSVRNFHHMLR